MPHLIERDGRFRDILPWVSQGNARMNFRFAY